MRKKQDLPQKICVSCGLPFSWRKKWARDWEAVRYCSKRCSGQRSGAVAATPDAAVPAPTVGRR